MAFDYAALEVLADSLIAQAPVITPEGIRALIGKLRAVTDVTDDQAEQLARVLETRHGVTMQLGSALVDTDFEPWLDAQRAHIDFYYWGRYRKLLESQGLSKGVVSTTNIDTDRTLEYLQNPLKEGSWSRRGMVVGHVQSGKTANYIGLACKAADAGYRLIVVIAGVHNNLRNQTQKRIDEGFVGRDSARMRSTQDESWIGVSKFDATRRPVTFTTSLRDFTKETASAVGVSIQNLTEPAILVIKKNSSTLKNLIEWIRENNLSAQAGGKVSAPLLLIDDEADNASINVAAGPGEISRINGQIRDLLNLFSRSCYVGYTATPFANIFIDPDTDDDMRGEDLFPKGFIVSLDPPTNYFGAARVFLDDARQVVRPIEDSSTLLPTTHKQNHQVGELPESLKVAVRTFVMARAIRIARGQRGKHNSMLVNVSRFTDVQRQVRMAIETELAGIKESVRLQSGLPPERALKDEVMQQLHQTWSREYVDAGMGWEELQPHLPEAASPIRVVEVNNRSHDSLNYDEHRANGLSVIAVGGFSLSRGLTLEGLVVSYFLRNSMMYDTLMQMGRWFGYRIGYDDLCRVWMLEDAIGWYGHIAVSIEQLREELRKMAARGATPIEFGLKVRAHPDTLIVTARNKMGSSEKVVVNVGLSSELIETAAIANDAASRKHNMALAQALIVDLNARGIAFTNVGGPGSTRIYSNAPVECVAQFLRPFENNSVSMLTDPAPVVRYIEDRQGDELALWDVAVIGLLTPGTAKDDSSLGFPVNVQTRAAGQSSKATLRLSNNRRVATAGTEKLGLTPEQVALAEADFWREQQEQGKSAKSVSDAAYRMHRERPLLMLHLIKAVKGPATDAADECIPTQPVLAWGISFPVTKKEETRVAYVVNTTWIREHMPDDVAPEEMQGDEE